MAIKPRLEVHEIRFMSPDTQDEFLSTVTTPGATPEHPDITYAASEFLQMMMNRMAVSYHKYGSIDENFPHRAHGVDQIEQRLKKYDSDGNLDWIIDVANYALIEFLRPCHPMAHFRPTDTDESPGRINKDGTVSHGRD